MNDNKTIYAQCYGANFNFSALQSYLLEKQSCSLYRNVLHLEWSQGDVFIFFYGVIVCWNLADQDQISLKQLLVPYIDNPINAIIDDEFSYETDAQSCTIKNDHIHLDNSNVLNRLAISHGIAQSIKLTQFESKIQQTINETAYIPVNIADTGNSNLSRKEIAKLRGRLYINKSDILLNYDLLDTPDFFWEYPELDHYYKLVSDYLELRQRIEVLSKKLETIHELFEMMADEQNHKHSSLLEWIIIWLIAFEIVVFLVHDIFKIL